MWNMNYNESVPAHLRPSDMKAWADDMLQQYCCPVATNLSKKAESTVLSAGIHSGQKQEMRRE